MCARRRPEADHAQSQRREQKDDRRGAFRSKFDHQHQNNRFCVRVPGGYRLQWRVRRPSSFFGTLVPNATSFADRPFP